MCSATDWRWRCAYSWNWRHQHTGKDARNTNWCWASHSQLEQASTTRQELPRCPPHLVLATRARTEPAQFVAKYALSPVLLTKSEGLEPVLQPPDVIHVQVTSGHDMHEHTAIEHRCIFTSSRHSNSSRPAPVSPRSPGRLCIRSQCSKLICVGLANT